MTFDPILNIVELTFTGQRDYPDPSREVALTVTFSGPDGRQQRWPAFWDGQRSWRVRFSPPDAGRWHYRTTCSPESDRGLQAQRGEFSVAPYRGNLPLLRHGPIRLAADHHSLAHADGTPFFWLADTAWNGVLKAQPADWDHYLATRKAQGFSAIQAVITHWRSFPADAVGEVAFSGTETIRLNPAFYQRLDRKIAAIAAQGLVPAPVLIWACTPHDPGYYLAAADCTWLARYEVARYAAFRPIWILGGDGEYRGQAAEKWKQVGRAVFADWPDQVVTMHPRGINWPGEDLRHEPWLTFHSYQSGHGDNDDHLRWLQTGPPASNWPIAPVKPVINLEPNYEHHLSYHTRQQFKAFHVRRACYWSLLVSPPAGVTYGHHGIWPWMEEAGLPADHPQTGAAPTWREALHAAGAEHMRHLRTFFNEFAWWTLRPAQALLASQPGQADPNRFIVAACGDQGDPAVVYSPGGAAIQLTRPLRQVRWFDPRSGAWFAAADGAEFIPPSPDDWLLIGQGSPAPA
jgi:hypothetical protein